MVIADVASDVWTAIAHQGPYVILFGAVLFAGYKRAWVFQSQCDREAKLKDELIAELRSRLENSSKVKDAEIARLEEERRREREEREMYRQYTFRLLEAARDQIPLVTQAVTHNRGQQQ